MKPLVPLFCHSEELRTDQHIKALNDLWVKQVIPGENPHPTLGSQVLWHWVPGTYLVGQVMVCIFLCMGTLLVPTF